MRLSRAQRRARRRTLFVVGLVVVLGAVGAVVAVISLKPQPPAQFESVCTVATGTTTKSGIANVYVLVPDQAQNASIIAAVAMQMGLPDHAVTVALDRKSVV